MLRRCVAAKNPVLYILCSMSKESLASRVEEVCEQYDLDIEELSV